ncbi:response regulator [Desulfocurvus sp. DL9XJH121]
MSDPGTSSTSGTHVIIVDDEAAFAAALSKRLSKRGFSVQSAPGGEACLELLAQGPAHVVVLDLRMPGMDGLETLSCIRERHPGTRTILLTGHGSVESATEGTRLGAFDFFMKPVDLDELSARIEEAAAASNPGAA